MTTPRQFLGALAEQGVLTGETLGPALEATGVLPSGRDWRRFLDHLLLWLGGLALAVGVIFFFAWNWNDLGRLAKFLIVQMLMVAAVAGYWKFGADSVAGKVSLFVAGLFLGVLLALYGQTYQTGADPWQLFFNWALLLLPWALIGRFAALWVLLVVLLNFSLVLYTHTLGGRFSIFIVSDNGLMWLLFAFNFTVLLAWEFAARSRSWLAERWPLRLVAVTSGSTITFLVLQTIFDEWRAAPVLVWLAWLGLTWWLYRFRIRDLFMLAGVCLSAIVVVVAGLARVLFEAHFEAGAFLILAVVVIAAGTGAAVLLRNVQRAWRT